MIDFKKKLNREVSKKHVNPIDLYSELDRSSTTGPLRPTQEKVLREWNDIHRGIAYRRRKNINWFVDATIKTKRRRGTLCLYLP